MKKWLIFIFVVMVFNFGCVVSTYNKADYIQNLNMIDFGKYKVALDKSFVPIGDLRGDIKQETLDDTMANMEVTRYTFVDTSEGKDNIKRAICIYQYRITDQSYFRTVASFDYYKHKHFEKGRTELDGVGDVAYLIRPIPGISKDILKLGNSKGFQMDNNLDYAVSVKFALVIGTHRMIQIEYCEGGDINYENNYAEVRRALNTADKYITLIK